MHEDAYIADQQDRIDALEAENADLRERVAAIESELGLDATADRQGVADD
jgi:cell division protein FtsB